MAVDQSVTDLIAEMSGKLRSAASKEHAELSGQNPEQREHVEVTPGDEPIVTEKADAANTRQLIRLAGAEDLATEEQRTAFAEGLADEVVAAVNAELARRGEPPLAKG